MANSALHIWPSASTPSAVLLATGQAKIITNNPTTRVRFLLDQGSELSFVTEDLVRQLLQRHAASVPLLGIGETYSGRTRGIVTIQLQSIYDSTSCCMIKAYILPRLTRQLPSFVTARLSWPHLTELQLADPDYGSPGPIQILIGADFYGQIIHPEIVKGVIGAPIAQNAKFGWILFGLVEAVTNPSTVAGYHSSVDYDLLELLTKFWTLEEIPSSTIKTLSPEEAFCEDHFKTTHKRDSSGKYIVRLPLKTPASSLGNSENAAHYSLLRLQRRFSADSAYLQQYSTFMKEYELLGHLTSISASEINKIPAYYLPHHGVLREQSQTTKLRVFFNGSSRTNTGISLNNILYAGPKLQNEISDVLLWTRLHHFFSPPILPKCIGKSN